MSTSLSKILTFYIVQFYLSKKWIYFRCVYTHSFPIRPFSALWGRQGAVGFSDVFGGGRGAVLAMGKIFKLVWDLSLCVGVFMVSWLGMGYCFGSFQAVWGPCGLRPRSRARYACPPYLPKFMLVGSSSDTLLVVSILHIVYDCHL